VKVTSEQQPPREAVLTVELDESDVEPYLERAYRQVVRRANIPGFRKGKAPRRIIERMFGRDYLLNEALDSMVQEVTSQAVEQEKLEMGGIPSVSIEQFDPPSFKATVPLLPSVDLGDYTSVRVPREKAEVSDEQVDGVLEQVRREQAVWEPVDEPVAMDDLLTMTIVGWVIEGDDRREILRSENADYIPRPGTRFPVPDFDDGLIGLSANKQSEFTIDVPEDFENADLAGKKTIYQATVHQVKRKALPALDDEFAKGVGDGHESIATLRDRVRSDLMTHAERTLDAAHQDATLAKVVEGAVIEMSPLIVEHEIEHYIEEREENMKAGRVTLEDYQQYLQWQAMSHEEVHEDARSKVEERLKRAHVLREVVSQQSLEANEEEIDAEVESMTGDAGEQADALRQLFSEPGRRDSIRRILVNRKAIEHLTTIAGAEGAAKKAPAKRASRAKSTTAAKPSRSRAKNPTGSDS